MRATLQTLLATLIVAGWIGLQAGYTWPPPDFGHNLDSELNKGLDDQYDPSIGDDDYTKPNGGDGGSGGSGGSDTGSGGSDTGGDGGTGGGDGGSDGGSDGDGSSSKKDYTDPSKNSRCY